MSRGRGQGKGQRAAKSGSRRMSQRVKTAKGRKVSSTLWLQRQLNDPYVAEARRLGYRSRAAFKLIELDDRFRVLRIFRPPRIRLLPRLPSQPILGRLPKVSCRRFGPPGVPWEAVKNWLGETPQGIQ